MAAFIFSYMASTSAATLQSVCYYCKLAGSSNIIGKGPQTVHRFAPRREYYVSLQLLATTPLLQFSVAATNNC